MRRKQASLVPTGEVVGELDGPVTAFRAVSPPARNYCTMAHQIGYLLKARDAEPELGFMARMLPIARNRGFFEHAPTDQTIGGI